MKRELTREQGFQERLYEYPYHYIPVWDGRSFSQCKTLYWGYEYLSYLHFVLERLMDIRFESLLDVGCGDGRLLFELNQRVPRKRLVGIDISERSIGLASLMAPDVEWVCGDITDPQVLPEGFDIVTLVETLEHIHPDAIRSFVMSLASHTKDGGILLLTVPSKNVPLNKKHFQHFDIETLSDLITPYFSVENFYYLNKKSIFIQEIYVRMLQNRLFVLNEKHLLNFLFSLYRRFFLLARKENCRRIAAVCRKAHTSNL